MLGEHIKAVIVDHAVTVQSQSNDVVHSPRQKSDPVLESSSSSDVSSVCSSDIGIEEEESQQVEEVVELTHEELCIGILESLQTISKAEEFLQTAIKESKYTLF